MKKTTFVILGILLLILVFWVGNNLQNEKISTGTVSPSTATITLRFFSSPVDNASGRVTKKPFGIYVNDRFQGFHTGVDFETTFEEKDKQVLIRAICGGKLILKEYAGGYGGVLVQECSLNDELITMVYGHIKLASVKFNIGDEINSGEVFGELGQGYSSETDGERKHLHLSIHKGSEINILGYVSSRDQLSSWIDPCDLVCTQ